MSAFGRIQIMSRKIWKELSPDILKRLEGEACQEYQRKIEELYTADSDDHTDEEKKLYNALEPDDKAAIGAEMENDILNFEIEHYVGITRLKNVFLRQVSDTHTEQIYIDSMQYKYVYPEYSQLVGCPSEEDFYQGYQTSNLTIERTADLLLLGVFEWKGLYITKAHCGDEDDPRGWLVCLNPNYEPTDVLGAKLADKFIDQMAFMPFHGLQTQWLHEYLFDCDVELGNREAKTKNQYVTFRDGNPYNCLPDNLILAAKRGRGRPMICKACGEMTTRENSMVVKGYSKKVRYCLDCLRKISIEG